MYNNAYKYLRKHLFGVNDQKEDTIMTPEDKDRDINSKTTQLDDDAIGEVAGGFGSETSKYTIAEYNMCGISLKRSVFSRNEYYYQGKKISQEEANRIVENSLITT